MTVELHVLVERASAGDNAAFHELVTATLADVRLFIATYVPTTALGDALLRESYAAIRRELARCPKEKDAVAAWMCRTAATLVGMRLADAARGALATKDPLSHIIAHSGAEALSLNVEGANPAATELAKRLQMQPPSLRQLLQRHYKDGLTVATIAEKQGLVESEVAQALMSARARMDWTGVAEVGDTADHTFPTVVEDFLTGMLVPDTRALLVAGVMHDAARATQFERQVRLHLLLQALLTPFEPAQVKEFVAGLPAHNESSRLVVPPRGTKSRTTSRIINTRKPPSGPRAPGETTRTRRQITETGAGSRGFVKSASGSRVTVVADDADLGEDAPPPQNRMPIYIGAGVAALGVLALIIVMWPSAPMQVGQPSTGATTTPTTAVGDPSFALIHQVEGKALIRHDGQSRPANVGDALSSGDGLELTGTGSLGALVADQVRVTLRADSQISRVMLQGPVVDLSVTQGRVQIEHRRGPKVTQVVVHTPQGQVTLPDASAQIEVLDGVTRVQVGRGKPLVARANGAGSVQAASGSVVVVRAGSDPAIDGGGVFVRGINFGDGVVTIERNQWLSLAEAMGAGLTISKSAHVGNPIQISGVGMDFDSKRMLDTGLIGDGGEVQLKQVVPNGDFDLSLWVAGGNDAKFDSLALTVSGAPVAIGPAASQAERWRRLGPYRIQVRGRALDMRLRGMGTVHLAGLELDAAGPLDGALPPMILITDPSSGAREPSLDLAIRTRVDATAGIAKVVFYNRDTVLGEATVSPYTFIWRAPAVGPFELTAVVTDNAGITSRSAVVTGVIQELTQSRGLMREIWRSVGGGAVNDLRSQLANPAGEIDLVSDTNQRLSGSDFGARFRAALTPPSDGDYIFEVLSDDGSEVWLSPNEDPANRQLVCSVASYVDAGQWDKFPSQRSSPIALKGGQRCFMEILYKQGGGGAHLQVGWIRPDGATERPIPSDRFSPLQLSGSLPPARTAAPDVAKPLPALAGPAPGVISGMPAVIARVVPSAPVGSLLQGTVAPSAMVANLSDLGASDWIHYGITDAASVTRRSGGDLLSVARTADSAQIQRYDNNQTRFGWSNGNPVTVAAATTTGWFTGNNGKGFTFTAPADPVLRRLMVWVGGHETHGIFTATLSDNSAPLYRDDSITIGGANGWYCYSLLYRAKEVGAKLTISYSSDKTNDGNITLQAAALSEYGDGKPRFIKGINFSGDAAVIAGNPWTAQKDAENVGLVIHNGRRVSATGEPIPAAETTMKAMLRSGVAAKGGDLEINDRLPNGRYDVTLFVMETGVANSHQFDVTLNDAELTDIGQLPKNGWAAYGPVTATVTKGVLSLIAKGKKGSPQLMGMSVFAGGDAGGPWTNAFPAGRAQRIPGTILFANFDRGVNGVAFQEREEKPRNEFYRTEPVGINQYLGAPVVAYISDGEWLRYTIAAAEPGTYTITVKYAKANGADTRNARVQFELDGKPVGEALRLEDTGRWDAPKTLTSVGVALTAGLHDLRALFNGDQDELGDFWSMELTRTGP